MKYETAIFDLDGTVLDTLEDLHASVNASLREFGLSERSVSEVRSFLGEGMMRLVRRAVPTGSDERTAEAVFGYFCGYYKDHCADHTRLYEGVAEAISYIRALGVKTALVSNKSDFAVRELVKKICPRLFDFETGLREGFRRKPYPDMALSALSVLGSLPANAIFIGDSEIDAATAKNLGCDCALVTWGFRERSSLEAMRPEYLIDGPEKLAEVFLS